MQTFKSIRAGLVAAALVSLVSASHAAAPAFSSMVVFGDSLSDTGNVYKALGRLYPFTPPYDQGRFSNGPVAVEHLAAGLGLNSTFYNFAFGGALSGTEGALPGTGLQRQVGYYGSILQQYGVGADPNGLFVVWGGGNDLRDLIFNLPTTVAEAVQAVDTVVANLRGIVDNLHGLGARNFLLPNMPDLGLTPDALGDGKGPLGKVVSTVFNQRLAQAYGSLAAQLQGERFYQFDTFGAQQMLMDSAAALGFTNLSAPCLDHLLFCNADQFLFWDALHPTARVHRILGEGMLVALSPPQALQASQIQLLSPVPEPQTWLLMAAGLALLLGRRQRSTLIRGVGTVPRVKPVGLAVSSCYAGELDPPSAERHP